MFKEEERVFPRIVVVKFREGTKIRLREKRLVALGKEDIRGLEEILKTTKTS